MKMIYIVSTVILLTYLVTIEALFPNRILGPADMKFQYLQSCYNNTDEPFKFSLEQRKYNRTVYIWKISLDTKYTVDDSMTVEVNLAVKKQGGYKQGAFYMKKTLCEALRTTIGDMYTTFLKEAVGIDDCPIPAGSYSMDDFFFDNTQFNIPQIYGEYEMTAHIYKDGEVISCLKAYFELAPKEVE